MKYDLSVVISALNEEKTVERVLKKVTGVFNKYKIKGQIVFMNNHSTDNTGKLADKAAKKDKRIKVIHRIRRKNTDLGSSLREGFKNATGKYLIIMDCDLSHDPNSIPNLLKNKDKADIIVGSRYVKGGKADMTLKRTIISKAFNITGQILIGTKVKDITTGFKLYNKKALDSLKLQSNGFGLHVEILVKALKKGYKAIEVPIHYKWADKKSTLNYRKQFKSYAMPLVDGFRARYFA